jgi:hypothetical protein
MKILPLWAELFHADRQTHWQTETDREIDRQRDRQTERQTDRETHRQRDTQTERQTERETDRQANIHHEANSRLLQFCESAKNTAESKQSSTCKLKLNSVCNVLAQFLAVSVHVYSFHESVMSLPYFLGIFLIFFDISSEENSLTRPHKPTNLYA